METKNHFEITGDLDSLKLKNDYKAGNSSLIGSLGLHIDEADIYFKYRFDIPHKGVPFIHTHSPEILIGCGGKRPTQIKTKLIEKEHINLES